MLALARLDGAVSRFHPEVAARQSSWDSSFAANVVPAADAPSSAVYRERVRQLVASLRDPATTLVEPSRAGWVATSISDGAVLVHPVLTGSDEAGLLRAIRQARTILIDIRGPAVSLPEHALAPLLLNRSSAASGQQSLRYVGLPDTLWNRRDQYFRAWVLRDGEQYEGGEGRDVVFLVDSHTVLPPLALALRNAGQGAIVGVATSRVSAAAFTYRVEMGEGTAVAVRVGRRLIDTAGVGIPVDTVVTGELKAVSAAYRWAARTVSPWIEASHDTAGVVRILPAPTTREWSRSFPSRGYRVLAAARLWSTMHYFFPYMREAGGDWTKAFQSALPRIERARDSLEYARAVARFAWNLHDSHVRVYSSVLWRDFYGEVPASAVVQFIEQRLVVTRVADQAAARAGLGVGDVVLAVDGESVDTRVARLSPYFVSSTPQALRERIADFILAGPDTTPARLTVLGAMGAPRSITIPRSRAYPPPSYQTFRDGPVVRILAGNVGYVDLERITLGEVDSAMAALASTRGIVFDGRGYPGTPAWVRITQRLHDRVPPPVAAKFEEYMLTAPDTGSRTMRAFEQSVFPAQSPRYSGRTALLIDERAISQAEHLGLHFRAANGTIFVGSPTMGANGGVTSVQLPGGLRVSFTGIRVSYPDGRPLQRVGLQPDVLVTPTISGIRQGRDEVLERAAECLLDDRCVPDPR
jgi:C-terminal processing protease CtpA/Prc